jgi:hypothetical protein
MRYLTGTILLCLAAAAPVQAQLFAGQDDVRPPAVAIIGGAVQYDLSGTGTRGFGGVRAQLPVLRHLLVEPGVIYMNYRIQGNLRGPRVAMWFPEVQLQAELPLATVRPYLGVGAGLAVASLLDEREMEATAAIAGGARVALPGAWGVGGELRVRAVDPFTGTTAEWGVFLSRRL